MASGPVLETSALTKFYGETRGIEGVDLAVEAGEVFGFIGPNGAGKTTTIRILLDLIRPTSGSARIFGLDVRTSSMDVHSRIGYLPSELELFDRLTGYEFIDWLARLRDRHDAAYTDQLADRLDLDRSRRMGDLSAGNKRKVGLVQALMHRPELLILDEPTSALDPLVQRELRTLLAEARDSGTTVFVSSHVLSEVETVCDRVATIVDGAVRDVTDVDELRAMSRRTVRAVVDGPVDPATFEALEGVSAVRTETSVGTTTLLELTISGSTDVLVKALSRFTVVDLVSEPLSLEDVFLETYIDGHDGADAS